jgi:hypothetical protein
MTTTHYDNLNTFIPVLLVPTELLVQPNVNEIADLN